jgi:hypothetical protein
MDVPPRSIGLAGSRPQALPALQGAFYFRTMTAGAARRESLRAWVRATSRWYDDTSLAFSDASAQMQAMTVIVTVIVLGLLPGLMLGWIALCVAEISATHPEIAKGEGCRGGACRLGKDADPRAAS